MARKPENDLPASIINANLRKSLYPQTTLDVLSRASGRNAGTGDDLVGSLSDAIENRRARQVFEWEKKRRNAARNAA